MSNYNAPKISAPKFMQAFGNMCIYDDKVSIATALVITDTVGLIKVPAGVRLSALRFINDDFDTGSALLVKIGYKPANAASALAIVDNYFGAAMSFLQAASGALAPVEPQFQPITFNEDVIIFATVTTAPAGGGIGNLTTIATGEMVGIK
jgi:hypothetical protein